MHRRVFERPLREENGLSTAEQIILLRQGIGAPSARPMPFEAGPKGKQPRRQPVSL